VGGLLGDPFWTTAGGAQHFVALLNPSGTITATVELRLFDANGISQGTGPLIRNLSPRTLLLLVIPSGFGLASPPTTGSLRINQSSGGGSLLGWYLQEYPNGRVVFSQLGVDVDNVALLLQVADTP
jgi:hypothetical protein